MSVTLDRFLRAAARQYRAEYLRRYRVTTALEIAHEKARQYLQNSLPARPGAF